MLANQSDFMAYAGALKSNYRKGVHRLETILSNPTHAAEFAANLGGVSVVLGVPIELPDRNSDKLLELLLGSAVADNAVETWLHQFYEFTDWNDLLSDASRCQEMANNPLIWRAAGGSKLAVGKSIATLAGLSCSAYKDIDAVAASSTAMAAIVAAPVAMAALWRSDTAIKALQANATAWKTFTGASSSVMGKTVAILAGLNPSSYADMTAIAASSTAMAAVAASSVAMSAVASSSVARNAVFNSNTAKNALDNSPLKKTIRAAYSSQSNNKVVNLKQMAFILKTTGYGSGTWTFYDVYYPATATTPTNVGWSGNAFSLYYVGTTITTQHGAGSSSDYIDIQYIPC